MKRDTKPEVVVRPLIGESVKIDSLAGARDAARVVRPLVLALVAAACLAPAAFSNGRAAALCGDVAGRTGSQYRVIASRGALCPLAKRAVPGVTAQLGIASRGFGLSGPAGFHCLALPTPHPAPASNGSCIDPRSRRVLVAARPVVRIHDAPRLRERVTPTILAERRRRSASWQAAPMAVAVGKLVERESKLAEIGELLDHAGRGEGGVMVVEGPVGIGKTALLDAAATDLSVFRVLRGRGGELERDLSFGLVREVFEPVVRAAGADEQRRWFAGAAQAAGTVLGHGQEGEPDPASVAFGLYWLLAAIAADQPVLLIADDLHWCDPASLRWLVYLARRIEGLPVALLAATRPVELGDPGPLGQLLASAHVRIGLLEPLSVDGTRELIARRSAVLPDDAFVRACHIATGGNPLLLGELLETAREEGIVPDSESAARIVSLTGERLRYAVLGRLGRLDASAMRLARAVAVLGDGCQLRHAAELADVEHATALTAVPALIAAGVLADRQPLTFEHPLMRSAVYSDVPAPVRAAQHGRAAALLRNDGAGSEAVARHVLKAEPVGEPWADEVLSDAARRALARGAPESAAAFLRRALDERPDERRRGELLRALGDALARLGDPAALEVLERALALASSEEARMEIAEASVDPLLANGRASEARSLLELVLRDSEQGDREQTLLLSAHLTGVYALSGMAPGDPSVVLRRTPPDASTQPRRYAAAVLAFREALFDGTADRVLELGRLATSSHAADAGDGRTMHFVLVAVALAGDPQHALQLSGRAIESSRGRGSLMGQGVGLGWRSLIQLLAGSVGDAETDARAALAVLADTQLSAPTTGATAVLAWALVERGELADAEALLAAAPAGLGWAGAALRCSRARLLIAAHRHADALAVLASVEEDSTRVGWRSSGPVAWRSLSALARLGVGDATAARRLAEEEEADSERFGCGRELARARRILGVVQGQIPILVSAVHVAREADAPLELAHALVEHGAALRRAGDRAAAKAPLLEGMELAARCSATALVERAGIELRAAGARPRRTARRGVDALTPSERRVASLAAEGLSNAEVAQALFVTVRTIEMHLSATYRKLGIASRSQLPASLGANPQAQDASGGRM